MPFGKLKALFKRDPEWTWPEQEVLEATEFGSDLDHLIMVQSRTLRSEHFEVNLHKMTCSCPGWSKLRAIYNTRDLRRICPHIRQAMHDKGVFGQQLDANQLVIDHARQFFRYHRTRDPVNKTTITFGYNNHDKDETKRPRVGVYGVVGRDQVVGLYNLATDQWMEEPTAHADLLRKKLREAFDVR